MEFAKAALTAVRTALARAGALPKAAPPMAALSTESHREPKKAAVKGLAPWHVVLPSARGRGARRLSERAPDS